MWVVFLIPLSRNKVYKCKSILLWFSTFARPGFTNQLLNLDSRSSFKRCFSPTFKKKGSRPFWGFLFSPLKINTGSEQAWEDQELGKAPLSRRKCWSEKAEFLQMENNLWGCSWFFFFSLLKQFPFPGAAVECGRWDSGPSTRRLHAILTTLSITSHKNKHHHGCYYYLECVRNLLFLSVVSGKCTTNFERNLVVFT